MQKTINIKPARVIFALILMAAFIIAWKWMPKDFSTRDGKIFPLFVITAAAAASTAITFNISESLQKWITVIELFVLPALWLFMTEYSVGNNVKGMQPLMLVLGYIIYFLAALIILVITGRIGWSAIIGTGVFMTHSVMNMFVAESRGYGIRTTDFVAAKTAINVASEYNLIIHLKQAGVLLLAVCLICLGFHSFFRISLKMRGILFLLAAIMTGGFCLFLWNDTLMNRYAVKPYMWYAKDSCTDHGAVLEFVAGIPYLHVKSPEDYSRQAADELKKQGASERAFIYNPDSTAGGEQVKPDIIVIMNESYSDLRNCGKFETDQEFMEYFYSLKDNVITGNLTVPVQGGITANTEFEFLTGYANAFLPTGVIAFQSYVKDNTQSICDLLRDDGYYSIFMHPYMKTGWNREKVYQLLEFDEVSWEDKFEGRDKVRGFVSDSGDYAELIDEYEEACKKGENVFIYNVTMQNHGGYLTEDYESTVHITDLEGDYPAAEQYLSLVKESDAALEELIAYFSKSERPVLICMFGDHTPAVENAFYDEIGDREGYSAFEKGVKIHQTPFIIYANYEIEETEYENISVNYLSALLLDTAGVDKNEWFAYQADVFQKYPVINLFGVKDAAGQWYSWEEASQFPELKEYAIVQYRELFDR